MPTKPIDTTRLWCDGTTGGARHSGVSVTLTDMPTVPGLPPRLRAIDFSPALRVSVLRESACAWRDMTPEERSAAQAFLDRVVEVVRGVVA